MSFFAFAIGPVQGFISQSRRTADGWVGSYLLSYLAGATLLKIKPTIDSRVTRILVPSPETNMLAAIEAGRFTKGESTIASIPNTVLVELDAGVDEQKLGSDCRQIVACAWSDVHAKIWAAIQKDFGSSQAIWDDQVARQWETYWGHGATGSEAFRDLAAHKAVRAFSSWREDGDRCTVCGQRQPLLDRSKLSSKRTVQSVSQECWRTWAATLNKLTGAPNTLVSPDGRERLCSICLIKRLMPWVDNPIRKLWGPEEFVGGFPSTSTMCTVEYRVAVLSSLENGEPAAANTSVRLEAYETALGDASANDVKKKRMPIAAFDCWQNFSAGRSIDEKSRARLTCDGDFWLYGQAVANEHGLTSSSNTVENTYRELIKASESKIKRPPIYWALIAMDGDSMGAFFNAVEAAEVDTSGVSKTVSMFAEAVPGIIRQHNGRTIFAGGDDVLAMLPLRTALDAASKLRAAFSTQFNEWFDRLERPRQSALTRAALPTISAAIVYAHHQAPLSRVIEAVHHLLKSHAKTIDGKDAIALQRFLRGGQAETFATKWDLAIDHTIAGGLDTIARAIDRRELANRAAYNLRKFDWLLASDELDPADRIAFLVSLLDKSRLGDETSEAHTERRAELAAKMLAMADAADSGKLVADRAALSLDPLIMARFLAAGGRE